MDKIKIRLFRKLEFLAIYLQAKCEIYFRSRKRQPLAEAAMELGDYFKDWGLYFYQYKFGIIERVYGEQDWVFRLHESRLLSEKEMHYLIPRNPIKNIIKTYLSNKYTSY